MRSLILIITIFSSCCVPTCIASASSSLSSSTSPTLKTNTTISKTLKTISPTTATSSSVLLQPRADPPATLEPSANCTYKRTTWPKYRFYIFNIANWRVTPDADGDGNGDNVVKILRQEMIACAGRILAWNFPDKESGLGGTIEMEVVVFFTGGYDCVDRAIFASGGAKLKCVGWWLMVDDGALGKGLLYRSWRLEHPPPPR